MIQDIAPHKLDNQYDIERTAKSADTIFAFKERKLLIFPEGDGFRLPLLRDFKEEFQKVFLFGLDADGCFLYRNPEEAEENLKRTDGAYEWITIKDLRARYGTDRVHVFAAYTAYQLSNWYTDNRFCGTCGGRTVHSKKERAVVCPSCGRTIYPRIIPAVIVGVINGDSILLTKYAGRGIHYNALIAGFTEIGETLEETVRREVMEEVGLKVKNIRYYKSQPWGIVDDLLAGFYCEVDGDTTIRLDTNELKEGSWVKRPDIVLQPDDYSLTNEMMTMFKEGKETGDGSVSPFSEMFPAEKH